MTERERFDRLIARRNPDHTAFFERPHHTRRLFFQHMATGLGGFALAAPKAVSGATETLGSVTPKGTAKNVIFLFLRGAPSHVDTFDFKDQQGVTPAAFKPEKFGDLTLPTGLLPNTAGVTDKIAIVRSGLSWARAHPLAQSWMQIGRNPTSVTGRIAPHIGSVVAIEKEPERIEGQSFPTFIAFGGRIPGGGYFPVEYGPFRTVANADGLAAATHPSGSGPFERRWNLLQQLDGAHRGDGSPLGAEPRGMALLYHEARRLMASPAVETAFKFTEEERQRYGNTNFGNSVLVARKIIEHDQGTRFIQVDLNGWDHHQSIYQPAGAGNGIYRKTREFDPAFAALIEDLDASGKLDETLVVACGEFGRTPGGLSSGRQGRDHYLQMFYVLAGGGIKGGTIIGATNDAGGRGPGAFTTEPGWSRDRDIRPEDIEATIYSALGIDWTTVRYDDPLDRGFYYVPVADDDAYAPVNELWA